MCFFPKSFPPNTHTHTGTVNVRGVRILLECILVYLLFTFNMTFFLVILIKYYSVQYLCEAEKLAINTSLTSISPLGLVNQNFH